MKIRNLISRSLPPGFREYLHRVDTHLRISAIKTGSCNPADTLPTVICVVRNGMDHVEKFLEHHRSIGLSSFVFLVNNSDDGTLDYLTNTAGIEVLQSKAEYSKYENYFKKYLIDRYCKNRWCLFLDIDEFFVYYGSPSSAHLHTLVDYLNQNQYDAVVTQMLDMFSNKPEHNDDLDDQCYYDLTDIEKEPYSQKIAFSNNYPRAITDQSISFHSKGIRWKLFGTDNGLTKVSLMKNNDRIKPFSGWHHCTFANFADISCALLHHPFSRNFFDKVNDAVSNDRYGHMAMAEYVKYREAIDKNAIINFSALSAQQLDNIDQLYDQGFLYLSPSYLKHLADKQLAS